MKDTEWNIVLRPTFIDDATYKNLIPLFFNELLEDFNRLQVAFSTKDNSIATLYAHKIKGTAGSYGAEQVSDISAKIEMLCKESQPIKPELVIELKDKIEILRLTLNKKMQLSL